MLSVDDETAASGAIQPNWLSLELLMQDKPGVLSENLSRAANETSRRNLPLWDLLAAIKQILWRALKKRDERPDTVACVM